MIFFPAGWPISKYKKIMFYLHHLQWKLTKCGWHRINLGIHSPLTLVTERQYGVSHIFKGDLVGRSGLDLRGRWRKICLPTLDVDSTRNWHHPQSAITANGSDMTTSPYVSLNAESVQLLLSRVQHSSKHILYSRSVDICLFCWLWLIDRQYILTHNRWVNVGVTVTKIISWVIISEYAFSESHLTKWGF